jgi:hypothetical protein
VTAVLGLFEVMYLEDHRPGRVLLAATVLVTGLVALAWGELRLREAWREALRWQASELRLFDARSAWQACARETLPARLGQLLTCEGYRIFCGPGCREPAPDPLCLLGFTPAGEKVGVACLDSGPEPVTGSALAALVGAVLPSHLTVLLVATTSHFSPEARRYADAIPEHLLAIELWDVDELASRTARLPFFAAVAAELHGHDVGGARLA